MAAHAVPNQSFDVLARFKPGTSIADTQEIVDTFKLFGLLGALGSRARHGMGSVALTALNVDGVASAVPDTKEQYVKVLSDLMGGANAPGLPPFTAFSRHTKIDISSAAPDALRLLEKVGATQQHYRLWGKDGKVNGQAARRLFKDDHDLMYKAAGGETIKTVPDRAVFGLPHNYFFSSSKKKADVNVRLSSGGKTEDTRRASPLLLHIHPFAGSTEFGAVHALLPALFLPQQGGIAVNRQREVLPVRPKWSVIYNYLTEYQTLHADPAFQNVLQGERLND